MRHRIISLLPSATEMACALGGGVQLVGRSHECDFPVEVTSLPVCTESKLLPHATSRELDEQIHNLLGASLSIYRLNTRLIQELKPTLILTQSQCNVCAVSEAEVTTAAQSAAEGTRATSDLHADKAYREHLMRVLTARAVLTAAGA